MEIKAENTETQDENLQNIEETQETTGETPEVDAGQGGTEDGEQVVVSIGDESPTSEEGEAQQAPQWVKELRKESRDRARRIRELEEENAKIKRASQPDQIAKPTLAECDYDEAEYERKYEAWRQQEQTRQAEEDRQKAEQAAQENAWKARMTAYDEGKSSLKMSDFEDAEGVVRETLNQTQMGIIVHGAANAALVTYALGRNPAKLKELAAIKDPIQFAFAAARLENQVKTTTRKANPPAAEVPVRGNTPASLGGDAELARLEADADRTGDRTKVAAYHRQKLRAANQ